MTREITMHWGDSINDRITVQALGEPGPGGAHRFYRVTYPVHGFLIPVWSVDLVFPSGTSGGLTNEVLLAVLIDRLQGFQKGQLACQLNGNALVHLWDAMICLQGRTHDRQARGVLGKQEP